MRASCAQYDRDYFYLGEIRCSFSIMYAISPLLLIHVVSNAYYQAYHFLGDCLVLEEALQDFFLYLTGFDISKFIESNST